MLDKKQNVFDDFQAATKWLVGNKYVNRDRIAIRGGSNGGEKSSYVLWNRIIAATVGILTTACANQAPQLYRCVITIGGIIDMLRVR